jgi:hypothetical protein
MNGFRMHFVVGPAGQDLPIDQGFADRKLESRQVVCRPRVPQFQTTGVPKVMENPIAELHGCRVLDVNGGQHFDSASSGSSISAIKHEARD